MSTNMEMVKYFIGEFYRTNSANLDEIVTDTFRFHMTRKLPLRFGAYVRMAEAIRNLVKLNIYDLKTDDDVVFKMKYNLEVLIFRGGFAADIVGEITVTLKNNLIDRIDVIHGRNDDDFKELNRHIDVDEWS